jgi:hypothetical protein
MLRHVLPALSIGTCLVAPAALAASVTNLDDTEHKVTVIEGDSKQDHVVRPGAVLQDICLEGCLIKLDDNDDDPYELEGSDVTSIEKGKLWGEDRDSSTAAEPGEVEEPSPPSPQP